MLFKPKKIFISLLSAALLAGCAPNGKISVPVENADMVYSHPDGYLITAPSDFIQNTALEEIELRLERSDCTIEVIRQETADDASRAAYLSYSYGFLNRSDLHTLDGRTETEINGLPAQLTLWHRKRSGEGDKNYYAVTDISDGTTVYTVVIKSDRSLEALDFSYKSIAQSLKILSEPLVTAKNKISFPNKTRTPMNAETEALYNEYFADGGRLRWGLYYHRQPVDGMEKFEAMEKSAGKMDMVLLYTEIYDEYDPYMVYGGLTNAWDSGKICEITLQTDIDADESDVYEILRGEHDDFLYAYAKDIVRFGHPVFMRPFNEMNGEWCNYSGCRTSRDPDIYIRLYKYVYNIFRECGAKNVIWVWNPNEVSYPTFQWNREELYYPGDEYVDVVGLSGYNTGTGIPGEKWRSFTEIYDVIYPHAEKTYNKPMIISEFGCASAGGDKLEWVREMFEALPERYPKIRAAVWLHERNKDENGNTTRSFYLDDTPGLPELFKKNISSAE